jgi:hypothetical protein
MKLTIAVLYLFFFTIIFLILAAIWNWRVAGVYFACPERGFISDFFPPFVRGVGDMYLKPQAIVYAILAVFVVVAVGMPALASWAVMRFHQAALKKAWR